MSLILEPAARSELPRALDELDDARGHEARHYVRGPMSGARIRESGGGAPWLVFEGHAAVFDQRYKLFEFAWGDGTKTEVYEEVAAGAFDTVLAAGPDVHFVDQHDMRLRMARTGLTAMGRLDLSADAVGLRTYAQINPELSYVRDLEISMRDGLVDQMSYAFMIGKETRDSHTDEAGNTSVLYRILEVSDLFDVSTVSQGANPQTDANLRYRSQIFAALGRAGTTPADLAAMAGRAGTDPAGANSDDRAGLDPAGGQSWALEHAAADADVRARLQSAITGESP